MTAALSARRDELRRDLTTPGKLMPHLSVKDTALVLGCSRWAVQARINRRILRKQGGRIPAAVVRAQLS